MPICILEDEIVGSAFANSRNARITVTNNNFGRFRVTASLLTLNFLVIGKVHGALLSHNKLGP